MILLISAPWVSRITGVSHHTCWVGFKMMQGSSWTLGGNQAQAKIPDHPRQNAEEGRKPQRRLEMKDPQPYQMARGHASQQGVEE
jgi:hypothetical protein